MKLYSKIGIGILACASLAFISPALKPSKTIHVVIDAGHGGHDFGAKSDAAIEKEIVSQIANKIKAQNTNQAIVLHFTRNEDEFVELHSRAALINNIQPDLFISLHINANANNQKSGLEFFINEQNPATVEQSKEIATQLNSRLTQQTALKGNAIIKNAPFMVLKKATVPGVLIELGYLTNENDKRTLTDKVEQTKIANTILDVVSTLK
ncbi:N-acetylmuramoyl-L-alanine amidase [Flavobacterium sp. 9R]|uniref:N-acetylmuramoyl-L-alanine amidase family protein n=1 Tax=Flavobacterium sp. 9R TaxID=2653143 RepID=UPI0012F0D02C|nr:N-acetylmuramoyl-L-alanine amidase [Flavobacterium sp. 9R]VXA94068.1 N-acetylmuramoyl-L-alanine amidase [Flavobacterium sp. 9R]